MRHEHEHYHRDCEIVQEIKFSPFENMLWLAVVVGLLVLVLLWQQREGFEENPYVKSMKQIHDEILKSMISQEDIDEVKKKASDTNNDLFKLQENLALQKINSHKNAYPDPSNVDMKA